MNLQKFELGYLALRIWRMKPSFFQFRKIVKSPKFKCTCSQRFSLGPPVFFSPQKTLLPNSNSRQISTKKGADFFRLFHQPFERLLGKLLLSPWDKLQFLSVSSVVGFWFTVIKLLYLRLCCQTIQELRSNPKRKLHC